MKFLFYITLVAAVAVNTCNKNSNSTSQNVLQQKNNEQNSFTLLDASSEDWVAGVRGGGKGTEYYFKIKINTNDNITFDTAWINNRSFAIHLAQKNNAVSNQPVKFATGDTITLRVSDIHSTKIQNVLNNNSPVKYEGAALIGYAVNNKREYFTIKEIKKQQTINRP